MWQAGQAAIDQIDEIVRELGLDCGFQWLPGYLHDPLGRDSAGGRRRLEEDADAAAALGVRARYLAKVPPFGPAVQFPHQAAFHPLQYLRGVLDAIAGPDCRVFERSAVTEVTADPITVSVGRRSIRGRFLVLATHTPLTGLSGLLEATLFQTKLALYSSYVVGARIAEDVLPEALWWDTDDPYRYLRVSRTATGAYAILGGADQKTGQGQSPEERFEELSDYLVRLVPEARVDHRWSGQVIETNDGLPFIGETAPNQFAATGFSGNGMTFGTLGAIMARDRWLGRENPWTDLLAPRRKTIRRGAAALIKENRDFPYYYVRDRLARAEATSIRSVRRNEGKILNLDGKKVAAYRDGEGRVTLRSPVCPHLGCIVRWNSAERTWDCPCHGSRFDPKGKVMAGPAEDDLAEADRP